MRLRHSVSWSAGLALVLGCVQVALVACGGGAAGIGTSPGDGSEFDGSADAHARNDGSFFESGSSEGGGSDGAVGDDADAGANADDADTTSDANLDGASNDAGDAGAAGDAADGAASDASADANGDAASDGGLGPCGIVNDTLEIEPNGTLATATAMPVRIAGESAICGTITSVGDLDFITFQLKPTATYLSWQWSGGVTPVFSVGGVTVNMNAPGAFQTGQPYVVQLTPNGGATPPLQWSFRVDEQ